MRGCGAAKPGYEWIQGAFDRELVPLFQTFVAGISRHRPNVPLQKRPTPPQAPTIIVNTEGSNYILVELNGDALGFSANPHCPLGPLAQPRIDRAAELDHTMMIRRLLLLRLAGSYCAHLRIAPLPALPSATTSVVGHSFPSSPFQAPAMDEFVT
jgi:hypothetical protein